MIRIAITVKAFEAIAGTIPPGSVAYETEANDRGERTVWLDEVWVDRLAAKRGQGESYSDVILRLRAADGH
jgi:ribosomal protein L20